MLIFSLTKYVSVCRSTFPSSVNSEQRTTVVVSINRGVEKGSVLGLGSDPSKVQRMVSCVDGGSSVKGSEKPAGGRNDLVGVGSMTEFPMVRNSSFRIVASGDESSSIGNKSPLLHAQRRARKT